MPLLLSSKFRMPLWTLALCSAGVKLRCTFFATCRLLQAALKPTDFLLRAYRGWKTTIFSKAWIMQHITSCALGHKWHGKDWNMLWAAGVSSLPACNSQPQSCTILPLSVLQVLLAFCAKPRSQPAISREDMSMGQPTSASQTR